MSTQTASYIEAIEHLPKGAILRLPHVSWEDYDQLLADLGDDYTYCIFCYKCSSILYITSLHRSSSVERPLPGGENKIGGHRITRNCEALGSFLLTCATTELSLIAIWCLIGATPRGQPWTPAVTLPHGRDGLSAQRMAVLCTFHEPSLCCHVHRELMRNAVLNLTLIIPATAYHQRNYVKRYSRYNIDGMYIKVKGQWRYLYRAVDKHGQTIDFLLTAQRGG